MHRALLIFAVALLGCDQTSSPPTQPSSANAQPPATTGPAVVEAPVPKPQTNNARSDQAFRRPFLWKAEHDDVEHTSYLFGSVHSGIEFTWETAPQSFRSAFDNSEQIVLEATADERTGPKVAARMMLPADRSLKVALGDENFARLVEMTGLQPEVLDRFRPWLAHATLVEKWSDDTPPMDSRILAIAEKRSKQVAYLDTVEHQLAALDAAITPKVLLDTMDSPDAEKKALRATAAAYQDGDVDGFRDALFGDRWNKQETVKILFEFRNDRWRPRIDERMREKPSLVVVGAGHLVGPHNLIDLLEEDGWRIARDASRAGP